MISSAEHALPAHALDVARTLTAWAVTADLGLGDAEVQRRRAQHGTNELARERPVPAWLRFARQLVEPVIVLLLAASALSLALGELLDAGAILAIVLLDAVLAFAQEERAERALASLQSFAQPTARVRRDGVVDVVPSADLVPGDIVELTPGDAVPADARLLAASRLRTQEAALTGESTPVAKDAATVLDPTTPLAERRNLVFLGTVVVAGEATAVVVATGMATELGRIAGMLRALAPRPTPLQQRLGRLGRQLAVLCVAIAVALATWYAFAGEPLGEVLSRSIALAVAAVPEGLPAVVAIALALGVRRLARANALLRHLHGVETLGSVSVVCTDKTGTLTRNEMVVREIHTPDATFRGDALLGDDAALHRALEVGLRCNRAHLAPTGDAQTPWRTIGDPTEGALLVAAFDADLPLALPSGQRIAFEVPFDPERRRMSVAIADANGTTVFAKGAAETLLPLCSHAARGDAVQPLTADARAQVLATAADLAARALRVLALARRDGPATPDDAEQDLVYVGLVAMQDPPRPQVAAAIAACRSAGIRPLMITGDHPRTALAIAREIGLAGADDVAVTSRELDGWDGAELAARLDRIAVVARATAENKLRLVRALQARGEVVAMTGDGVNDAPALGEADIGIAMGRSGTDVTRQAADLVLLDDDFATIVAAVREGRGIFDNIQKFVHYLLATNSAEIQLVVLAAAVGWPAPLTTLQLLWTNLVTDGLPALALGVEPIADDVLTRPPRPLAQGVVGRRDAWTIVARGLLATAAAAAAFTFGNGDDVTHARTLAFTVLVFAQLAYVFAFRSPTRTLWSLGLRSNPQSLLCVALAAALQVALLVLQPLRELFGLVALTPGEWALALGAGLLPATVVEGSKLVRATSSPASCRSSSRPVSPPASPPTCRRQPARPR